MKIIKLFFGALTVAIALAIGFVLYLYLADLSVYEADIEAAVSDALGHELSIDGDVDIEFGGQLRLTAVDITLANPEWPNEPVYVYAEKIQIALDTWTLLRGPIEIDAVVLSGVTISLQESADGKANWHRPDDQIQADSADAPILHSLVIDDLLFSLQLAGTAAQIIDIGALTLERNDTGLMSVRLSGSHKVESSSIPYSLSASLSLGSELIELNDMRVTFGEGEFSGLLSVRTDMEKPLVTANIDSPRLDLRFPRSEALTESVADNEVVENAFVFSDTPLNSSWLNTIDLNAQAVIDEIVLDDDRLLDININVVLADGSLTVEPFEFKLGGGGFAGNFALYPDDGKHVLDLSAEVTDLRIGSLAEEDQKTETLPPLNLRIELNGRGDSLHDIMGASSGHISGTQSTGQINLQAAGFLFSDIVTSILRTLNPLAASETLTTLECGIYELHIDEGIATIETLAIQTKKMNIVSSGTIDLTTEVLDLSLRVKTREGLGLSLGGVVNSFLKIGGTLKAPAVGIDAAGGVTTAGAAIVTGGLSVLARGLWDRVSAEVNMCSDTSASTERAPTD